MEVSLLEHHSTMSAPPPGFSARHSPTHRVLGSEHSIISVAIPASFYLQNFSLHTMNCTLHRRTRLTVPQKRPSAGLSAFLHSPQTLSPSKEALAAQIWGLETPHLPVVLNPGCTFESSMNADQWKPSAWEWPEHRKFFKAPQVILR